MSYFLRLLVVVVGEGNLIFKDMDKHAILETTGIGERRGAGALYPVRGGGGAYYIKRGIS